MQLIKIEAVVLFQKFKSNDALKKTFNLMLNNEGYSVSVV